MANISAEDLSNLLTSLQTIAASTTAGNAGLDPTQLQALTDALTAAVSGRTATATTFALTPGQHDVENIIDYGTKEGKGLYESAIKALPIEFDMQANGTVVFIENLKTRAKSMGWSIGSKKITEYTVGARTINLITEYGHNANLS